MTSRVQLATHAAAIRAGTGMVKRRCADFQDAGLYPSDPRHVVSNPGNTRKTTMVKVISRPAIRAVLVSHVRWQTCVAYQLRITCVRAMSEEPSPGMKM